MSKTMAKTMKNTLKAKQNRDRVNLHRAWKRINFSNQINSGNSQQSNANASQYDENDFKNNHICESLRRWALNFNISKRAVNGLLKMLISFGISVPSDSRTLLTTPRSVELKSLTNGEIW